MNRLAIVIPYYKIDFFEETLISLRNQSDNRFELYIANDASPNDPLSLIDKYFSRDSYHYFNYENNWGGKDLVSHWERILANVKEEWFQILGDDDVISVDFVKTFYKNYEKFDPSGIGVVKYRNVIIDSKSDVIFDNYSGWSTGSRSSMNFMLTKLLTGVNSSLSEHVFKRSNYLKCKFVKYPLAWHTDDMLFLQCANFNDFYFIEDALVTIRIFEKSISGSTDKSLIKQEATRQFYKDLSSLVHKNAVSKSYLNLFFKGLEKRGVFLGKKFVKERYYDQGNYGRFSYMKNTILTFLFKFKPSHIFAKFKYEKEKKKS